MIDPFSLSIIVGVTASFFFGGAVVAVVIVNWDKILVAWEGKRIAILGMPTSGKTVLYRFLTNGQIPEKYLPTQSTETTEAQVFRLKDLRLSLSRGLDVPGLKSARARQWKRSVLESDILIYLVPAHLLKREDDEAIDRLETDTAIIRSWLPESPVRVCFIIGTWADQTPDYRRLDGAGLVKLQNWFEEHPSVRQAVDNLRTDVTPDVQPLIGSLQKVADRQRIATILLTSLIG